MFSPPRKYQPFFSNWAAVILLFIVMILSSPLLCSANPFTGKSTAPEQGPEIVVDRQHPSYIGALLSRVTFWQMQLRQSIAEHVRNYKEEGKILPLLPLFFIAFSYGVIHAAGPGHGKAVAMTYALANNRSYHSGLLLGCLIAFVHAGSAITLIVALRLILEQTVSNSLEEITHITRITSYSLIFLLGLGIFISSLSAWFKIKQQEQSIEDNINRTETIVRNPLTAAFIIGIVPCPGVIMILLFCLSLSQFVLGLLLCFTVSIGMALSITLAVWLILAGKKITLKFSAKNQETLQVLQTAFHSISGILLMIMGGLFLATA